MAMRTILYHMTMACGAKLLRLLHACNVLVAQVTQKIAEFFSKKDAEFYSNLLPQLQDLNELNILQATYSTRDDALEKEEWTENHYFYLSQLMEALHENHGWTKTDIDNHMGVLVSSGPEGYAYEPSDEDDYE